MRIDLSRLEDDPRRFLSDDRPPQECDGCTTLFVPGNSRQTYCPSCRAESLDDLLDRPGFGCCR